MRGHAMTNRGGHNDEKEGEKGPEKWGKDDEEQG